MNARQATPWTRFTCVHDTTPNAPQGASWVIIDNLERTIYARARDREQAMRVCDARNETDTASGSDVSEAGVLVRYDGREYVVTSDEGVCARTPSESQALFAVHEAMGELTFVGNRMRPRVAA